MPGATRTAKRALRVASRHARSIERRVLQPLHVFAYHRVATPECDPWDLAVSPTSFEAQLVELRRRGAVVDLVHELNRGRRTFARRPRFAVTFDDGYVDVLHDAVPILERHDVPATVFVPSAFVDAPSFWWDRMDLLILRSGASVAGLAQAFRRAGVEVEAVDDPAHSRRHFHEQLHEQITWLAPDEIERVLDAVTTDLALDPPQPDGRPVTSEELKALASHPLITIGAHTRHHRMLDRLSVDAVTHEISSNLDHLSDVIGVRPSILAYPHGRANRTVGRAVRRTGVRHALTTAERTVSVFDSRWQIPRRNPVDLDGPAFARWLDAP